MKPFIVEIDSYCQYLVIDRELKECESKGTTSLYDQPLSFYYDTLNELKEDIGPVDDLLSDIDNVFAAFKFEIKAKACTLRDDHPSEYIDYLQMFQTLNKHMLSHHQWVANSYLRNFLMETSNQDVVYSAQAAEKLGVMIANIASNESKIRNFYFVGLSYKHIMSLLVHPHFGKISNEIGAEDTIRDQVTNLDSVIALLDAFKTILPKSMDIGEDGVYLSEDEDEGSQGLSLNHTTHSASDLKRDPYFWKKKEREVSWYVIIYKLVHYNLYQRWY